MVSYVRRILKLMKELFLAKKFVAFINDKGTLNTGVALELFSDTTDISKEKAKLSMEYGNKYGFVEEEPGDHINQYKVSVPDGYKLMKETFHFPTGVINKWIDDNAKVLPILISLLALAFAIFK
jgi:uncharacterized protein (DUF2249 family)